MKKTVIIILTLLAAGVIAFFIFSDGDTVLPKPKGYFRIDLPEKKYVTYESNCPLTIEVPAYGKVELFREHDSKDSCWFNVFYPRFNARIHCTYLPVTNNFELLIRDAYDFAASHEMKASGLRRTLIEDDERNVYGIVYDIEGEAASRVQFFLTDSTSHFLRGFIVFFQFPQSRLDRAGVVICQG